MWSKLLFRNMKLQHKFLVVYFAFAFIPIFILAAWFITTSMASSLDYFKASTLEIVKKNNQLIDIQLSSVNHSINTIANDRDFFYLFEGFDLSNELEAYRANRWIGDYLSRKFGGVDVASAYVVTRYFGFGRPIHHDMFFPFENFYDSMLYERYQEYPGIIYWFPTYDFAEVMQQYLLIDFDLPYSRIFSVVRSIDNTFYDSRTGTMRTAFDSSAEMFLVINFIEDFFTSIFQNSVPFENSNYLIIDNNGNVMYNMFAQEFEISADINDVVSRGESGYIFSEQENRKYILFYDAINTTGWTSVVQIPYRELHALTITSIVSLVVLCIIVVLFTIFMLNLISAKMLRPLSDMVTYFEKAGKGDFSNIKTTKNSDEVGILVNKFNEMNTNVKSLIEQNYLSKINEAEARIMALTMQLNPHFLYNSLNAINWIAIANNQDEISEYITGLANMLKYAAEKKEVVSLREDIQWLKYYILLMQKRYNGIFDVTYDIDESLMDYAVPKLCLQPIVENSILHAFKGIRKAGSLAIKGYKEEDKIILEVSDNGIGMSEDTIAKIFCDIQGDTIGIPNVYKRVKLLYGSKSDLIISSDHNGTSAKVILWQNEIGEVDEIQWIKHKQS